MACGGKSSEWAQEVVSVRNLGVSVQHRQTPGRSLVPGPVDNRKLTRGSANLFSLSTPVKLPVDAIFSRTSFLLTLLI
jgi:hypothetical protein